MYLNLGLLFRDIWSKFVENITHLTKFYYLTDNLEFGLLSFNQIIPFRRLC